MQSSIILIVPFNISADNYHAVDDSVLCVFTLLPMVESSIIYPFIFQIIWIYIFSQFTEMFKLNQMH